MLKLYHVTPLENVDSIMANGLIPRYGKPTQGQNPAYNAVYFHTKQEHAWGFKVGKVGQWKKILCIHLPINDETAKRLMPDEDTFHKSAVESIKHGDGVAYRGTIPPEWIKAR